MKTTAYYNLGGLKFTQNRISFLQDGFLEAFSAIAKLIGNKVILCGVEESSGIVSDGWISYNEELIRFVGGSVADNVIIVPTVATNLQYADGVARDVHFDKIAQCGAVGDFPFSDLKRMDSLLLLLLTQLKGFVSYVATDVHVGDISGDKLVNIAIPDQGTADYVVSGSLVGYGPTGDTDNDVAWIAHSKTNVSFKLWVSDMNVSVNVQNLKFDFCITKKIA